MKTITLNLYSFNELSEESKKVAIESIRNEYYKCNEFLSWAIDDCALLEPKEKELSKLLGKNYDFPLIKNNRKIYFSLDRNRYIDISNCMEITNKYHFLIWLGLNNRLIEKTAYTIKTDTIEFEPEISYNDFTEIEQKKIEAATLKFENHCKEILNNIEEQYDYRFTDQAIIEDINSEDFQFTKEGNKY